MNSENEVVLIRCNRGQELRILLMMVSRFRMYRISCEVRRPPGVMQINAWHALVCVDQEGMTNPPPPSQGGE